jgi:hypothetical protein
MRRKITYWVYRLLVWLDTERIWVEGYDEYAEQRAAGLTDEYDNNDDPAYHRELR